MQKETMPSPQRISFRKKAGVWRRKTLIHFSIIITITNAPKKLFKGTFYKYIYRYRRSYAEENYKEIS